MCKLELSYTIHGSVSRHGHFKKELLPKVRKMDALFPAIPLLDI
jgi:hypothetical protein